MKMRWSRVLVVGAFALVQACGDDEPPASSEGGPDAGSAGGSDAGQTAASGCPASAYCIDGALVPPTLGVRTAEILTVEGASFKDLDGDGQLTPYEDWRASPRARAADLVSRMSVSQKIGLLSEGALSASPTSEDAALSDAQVAQVTMSHLRQTVLRWPARLDASVIARHLNALQALAEAQPLGIPVLVASDPVFSVYSDAASAELTHGNLANQLPDWPLPMGFGAIDDPARIREFGRLHAEALRAVGVRWFLGPFADLASEPMWSRIYDTFGARSQRSAALVTAYVRGMQGKDAGVDPFTGVATTVKHFPGGGPNENGMDSHTVEGRFNVFPGNNFAEHLDLMRAVITDAKPAAIMPNYSVFEGVMWQGQSAPLTGSAFAKLFLTDILREDIGFEGLVTSDWGAVGSCLGGLETCTSQWAWGTEMMTPGERAAAYVEAGGDQIGLWADARPMWEAALEAGVLTEAQIDLSARRALELSFAVGAFENPYVDPSAAVSIVEGHADAAEDAMRSALTLLKNDGALLPFDGDTPDLDGAGGVRVYYDGIDDETVTAYLSAVGGMTRTTTTADADYVIVRISARHGAVGLDGGVPLSFRDPVLVYDQATDYPSSIVSTAADLQGNTAESYNIAGRAVAEHLDRVVAAKRRAGSKLVLVVSMIRPFVISEWLSDIDALVVDFGATDTAVLDLLFQMRRGVSDPSLQPSATLPMELPSSQQAVYDAFEDVPADSAAPSFPIGSGMTSY